MQGTEAQAPLSETVISVRAGWQAGCQCEFTEVGDMMWSALARSKFVMQQRPGRRRGLKMMVSNWLLHRLVLSVQ